MARPFRVAFCSVDPIGLTTFDAFDPDSFSVTTAIADALIYIDGEGHVRPALALTWERTGPLSMDFELRRGVRFHDGSPFDAEDVVATFDAHRDPTPSACGGGILSPIAKVTALRSHRVRIDTTFPDAMLLRRLFFGQIYPKSVLSTRGRAPLGAHPIGTGAYRFVAWNRGQEIVLERNPEHFAGVASIDSLHLVISRQKAWVDKLILGQIDAAFNLDAHDAVRARTEPGVVVQSRSGSVAQQFLLRNQGPLADVRVRRAMNHAIHRRILVELTEHGMGSPQRSVTTPHEEGYAEGPAHRYSPDLARRLLKEAGFADGFALRGLVCETSTSLYFAVREFMARVGIELSAEVVPLAEWMRQVVIGNLAGNPYDGDFAVTSMGNPLAHSLFWQFANVFSQGPGSLTRDPEYDAAFLKAATVIDPRESVAAVQALERFACERAYMLFTVNQFAHAAWREEASAIVPLSGLPTSVAFWALRAGPPTPEAPRSIEPAEGNGELDLLLEGTSHAGTFYLRPDVAFDEPATRRIWANIVAAQERWRRSNEPLLRELVSLVDAKDCLSNVLDSTHRVAIIGYGDEGRRLFFNRGYEVMLGHVDRPVTERLPLAGEASWPAIRSSVDADGSWSRSVELERDGQHRPYFLTVTQAVDDEGAARGYTFVFSDFSGEEERIKNAAIRTVLDNVPYALFACDRAGRVLPGYSAACRSFFIGATVEGAPLTELLGLAEREASHFVACYEQLIDNLLPSELCLAQLPKRLHVAGRICALSGAVIRSDSDEVSGVLFTLLDVTELAEAESEAERLRGVVHVFGFRSSFEAVARRLDADLGALLDALAAGTFDEVNARRTLHTAKGDFAQFKLDALAALIHRIEDTRPLGSAEIQSVRTNLRETLHANASVWNIQLEAADPTYSVSESALRALQADIRGARSLEEAQELLSHGCERLRQRHLADIIGPVQESAREQAVRAGKAVLVHTSGLDLRAPLRLERALGTVIHLTRNAVDHAIEPPSERGDKPLAGSIGIAARVEKATLVVEVSDDGRGIDVASVVERAVAMGALPRERASQLAPRDAIQLVFIDGVSTSDGITDTSGRGVGMAAVQQAVLAAGGAIGVETTPGRGTCVALKLPL